MRIDRVIDGSGAHRRKEEVHLCRQARALCGGCIGYDLGQISRYPGTSSSDAAPVSADSMSGRNAR